MILRTTACYPRLNSERASMLLGTPVSPPAPCHACCAGSGRPPGVPDGWTCPCPCHRGETPSPDQ